MCLHWFGSASHEESCHFGTLAVVAPLLERLGVTQLIDQHLPADPQAEYAYGPLLSLLIAARLAHPVALVNIPDWARRCGADFLWGIPAEKLNDDRLGRALDAFYYQRHSSRRGRFRQRLDALLAGEVYRHVDAATRERLLAEVTALAFPPRGMER
jgi:hypothetical protein